MRRFSLTFLDRYLATAGASVYDGVGCYQLEGLGVQLFEEIDGDYFTILGNEDPRVGPARRALANALY